MNEYMLDSILTSLVLLVVRLKTHPSEDGENTIDLESAALVSQVPDTRFMGFSPLYDYKL